MDKFMDSPWFLRLTALALALFLFFSVRAEQDKSSLANVGDSMEIIQDVPIEVYYDNENYVVTGVPETVNMKIKGPSNLVQRTKLLKDFALKVDLRTMPMGSHTVQIQSENISDKIDVQLDPATIEVNIEEKITKSFKVDPELNDQLIADDFELVRMEVEPSTIEVTGGKSIVDSINFVKVSVSGEAGINKSFEQKGRVRVLDRDLNKLNVEIEPEEVTVKVEVEAYHKDVPLVVKPKGKPKAGITVNSLTSDERTVTVYGTRKAVDEIRQLIVDLDVSDISGNGKKSVEIVKPKGISKTSPDKVNVNVDVTVSPDAKKDELDEENSDDEASAPADDELAESDVVSEEPSSDEKNGENASGELKKTRKFSTVEIGLQGLDKQYNGKVVKPANGVAELTVSGEEKTIDALTESDITIYAEGSAIKEPGDHILPIFVKVPPGIHYELNFKDVTVMVEQA